MDGMILILQGFTTQKRNKRDYKQYNELINNILWKDF